MCIPVIHMTRNFIHYIDFMNSVWIPVEWKPIKSVSACDFNLGTINENVILMETQILLIEVCLTCSRFVFSAFEI